MRSDNRYLRQSWCRDYLNKRRLKLMAADDTSASRGKMRPTGAMAMNFQVGTCRMHIVCAAYAGSEQRHAQVNHLYDSHRLRCIQPLFQSASRARAPDIAAPSGPCTAMHYGCPRPHPLPDASFALSRYAMSHPYILCDHCLSTAGVGNASEGIRCRRRQLTCFCTLYFWSRPCGNYPSAFC